MLTKETKKKIHFREMAGKKLWLMIDVLKPVGGKESLSVAVAIFSKSHGSQIEMVLGVDL